MSLLRCKLTTFSADLTRPLVNANSSWRSRSGLYLRVHRDNGAVGQGEASPLPGYSPDTLDACATYLRQLRLFPADELCLLRVQECIEKMPQELPAARFAVECALLDLLAQERSESISELLGGTCESASRSGLIASENPVHSLRSLQSRGICSGKLKVGRDWGNELAIVQALRDDSPSFRLRLDVNSAWSLNQAMQRLQNLTGLGIEFVEQPVAPSLMHKLMGSPVPIAADESMHTTRGRDALGDLVGSPSLVAVVLKPTVLGGVLACMKHKAWADTHGMASIVSHCFEGAVASAAVAELAIACKGPYHAGVDRHDALALLPAAHIPQFQDDGLQRHRFGLGVTFHPSAGA